MQRALAFPFQGSEAMRHGEEHRPTVLLVEDSEDNRFMMRLLLEMTGYEVLEATNGEEAVKIAQLGRADLVLMDLSLPVMDGLTAIRQIRTLPELAAVPIVVVTAHDTLDFYGAAMASGCNEYVTKPIDFLQLESLLERLLPTT